MAAIVCGQADSETSLPGEAGSKAPGFSLRNYDDRTYGLSDFPDKIVVLIWFDYTCQSVIYQYEQSMTLIDLPRKYRDQNVAWLAINSSADQTTERNRVFAREHRVSYPILDDRTGDVGHSYGADTTPQIIVIDTNGKIAYNGAIDYLDNALTELTTGHKVHDPTTAPRGCSIKYAQ